MKQILHSGPSLLIGVPTLGRPVPLAWALAFKSLNPPINYNTVFHIINGLPVAEARQQMAEIAIEKGCKYLFFLGDDTEIPNHTLRQLIYRLDCDDSIGVVGGVYCVKAEPSFPLVFRGQGNGSYWDWKIGEFFEVTGLGMDCTLIRTSVLEKMSKPWFKTVDTDKYLDGINAAESWTEDLWFFDKMLKETDSKVYCDGGVICNHWDVYGNKKYTLPMDSPPMRQLATKKEKKCLVIGNAVEPDAAFEIVTFGKEGSDYRGNVMQLPFEEKEFDKVFVEADTKFESYVEEVARVVKPGGTLVLNFFEKYLNLDLIAVSLKARGFTNGTIQGNSVQVTV